MNFFSLRFLYFPIIRVLLSLAFITVSSASAQQQIISESVNHIDRPAQDKARDTDRNPEGVLAFFGIKPGMKVLEVFAADGYYTELMSRVVGDRGAIFAHNNKYYLRFVNSAIKQRIAGNRLNNVTQYNKELDNLEVEGAYFDAVVMVLNFHDIYHYGRELRDKFLAQLYATLKVGGIVGIVDHFAPAGSQHKYATTLHRIDKDFVIKELTNAGLKLVDESSILRHPSDSLDLNVYNDAVSGKTDRFVLRFQKIAKHR